jgi:hypothetical protein
MPDECTPERLRLLECWLPFAQHLNAELGWQCEPAELEALILAAADDLGRADSDVAARAVLWAYHLLARSNFT